MALKLTLVRHTFVKKTQTYNNVQFGDNKFDTITSPGYTKGKLYINGKYECDTLEDRDYFREENVTNTSKIGDIERVKNTYRKRADKRYDKGLIYDKKNIEGAGICIQSGSYTVDLNTTSGVYEKGAGRRKKKVRPNMTTDENEDYIQKMIEITNPGKGAAKMPRLDGVDNWTGILIHLGVNELNTEGCIMIGDDKLWSKKNCKISEFYDIFKR